MARRSRKRRSAPARPAPAAPRADAYARSRARDDAARAALTPLAPGERPVAVTVAAVVCAVGVAVLVVGWATGLIEHRPGRLPGVLTSIAILAVASAGMWRGRYWAVLGFEALLVVNVIAMVLLLLRASSLLGVAVALAVIVPAGWLFWKLVGAMARMQMPRRP